MNGFKSVLIIIGVIAAIVGLCFLLGEAISWIVSIVFAIILMFFVFTGKYKG